VGVKPTSIHDERKFIPVIEWWGRGGILIGPQGPPNVDWSPSAIFIPSLLKKDAEEK